MPSKNKARGNQLEREIVKMAQEQGLEAQRAWGSDGRSMGLDEAVDCVVEGYEIQAKRRKKIADFLKIPDCCQMVVFREDGRKNHRVLMELDLLFGLLSRIKRAIREEKK